MAKYTIREGRREDCKEIRRLIQELADFQKIPNGPKIGAEDLERDGFDVEHPFFYSFVAECVDNPGVLVGYAVCYHVYSGSTGRKLFLENICVTEEHHRRGVGIALMRKVVQLGLETNCRDIDFYVLEWNPAKDFYFKIGASDESTKQGLRLYRIRRPQMEALLAKELADFHNEPDSPEISAEGLERDGFDLQPPLYHSYVAELDDEPGVLGGYVMYHYAYGTWRGRKVFLRHLYVTDSQRGSGLGYALTRKVVEKTVQLGCQEVDFQDYDWNPARSFYFKIGSVGLTESEGWRLFTMGRSEMEAFVRQK